MSKKNLVFVLAFALIILSSCTTKKTISTISLGDNADDSNVNPTNGNIENLTENQTFGTYQKETSYIVEPSNEINFNLAQKERIRYGLRLRLRGKNRYAIVAVDKYFYRFQLWRPIVGILAIPLTYGSSLAFLPPTPHKKDIEITEVIKDKELIDRTIYHKKILIETKIWCKKDVIDDDVVIVENLPDIISVNSYKVKTKRGGRRIDSVKHEEKVIDGQNCHIFTIKAKDGVFKKKNKIWIILDVTIKPQSLK